MKQKIQKITAFLLALIVLISSVSFTVNKHICGGKIAHVSYFAPADSCGMQMDTCENKNSTKKNTLQKEPCCKDVSEFISGNDIPQQAIQSIHIPQVVLVSPLKAAYSIQTIRTPFEKPTNLKYYRPPILVKKHRQDFLQVFRI